MTIEFNGLTYTAECDSCGEDTDTGQDRDEGFVAAVDHIKSEGWQVTKRAGEWVHLCPDCKGHGLRPVPGLF